MFLFTRCLNDDIIYTVIEYDNNLYYSNNYIRTIYQSKSRVEYTWTADKDTDTTLVDGDVVKYKFYIKNVGKIDINELSAELDIDSGLKLRNVVFPDGSETISLDVNKYNKFVLYDFPLNVGKDAYIEYEFKVDDREVYSIDTPPPTVNGKIHIHDLGGLTLYCCGYSFSGKEGHCRSFE